MWTSRDSSTINNSGSHRNRKSSNGGILRVSNGEMNCCRWRYQCSAYLTVLFHTSIMIASVSGWVEKMSMLQSLASLASDGRNIPLMKHLLLQANTAIGIRRRRFTFLTMTGGVENVNATDGDRTDGIDSNNNLQWKLFCKHHSRYDKFDDEDLSTTSTKSWIGKWTTYDYVGDVVLETMPASVNYISSSTQHLLTQSTYKVDVTHTIATGSTKSDCETCFGDPNTVRTIPITTYTPENIGGKSRLGACGMVVGPSIMRSSGTMATELVLSHTNSRVRILFQHAPVWARGTEAGSCPPQGLKLIRCLLARESVSASTTVESSDLAEIPMPGTGSHPAFDRSVPPFDWHKKWSGTSWTWGPEAGDRGWSISELEIGVDDWHGCAPVEAWNLRIPGGVFIQLPRVVTSDVIERCRLAWMPDKETLLRLEAGVIALQPLLDLRDDSIVGFEPPTLASFRCDVLQNEGDLEGVPSFVREQQDEVAAFRNGENEFA